MNHFFNFLIHNRVLRPLTRWVDQIPILSAIQRRVIRLLPNSQIWVEVREGPIAETKFLCDSRAHMAYVRGVYEPFVIDWMRVVLERRTTFVDIGAHIGYFSLAAARILHTRGRVLAVEPDPRNVFMLSANVDCNHLSDVIEVLPVAVGRLETTTAFAGGRDFVGRVLSASGFENKHQGDAISVQMRALDDLNLDGSLAIKIDVEGSELEVLYGAQRVIEQRNSDWLIEVHSHQLEIQAQSFLRSAGYEVTTVTKGVEGAPTSRRRYLVARSNHPRMNDHGMASA